MSLRIGVQSQHGQPMGKFDRYVRQLEAAGWAPGEFPGESASPPVGVVKLGRRVVPKRLRSGAKQHLTAAVRPRQRRRAAAMLAANPELKLHLGCGSNHLAGWVNIDLLSSHADLAWDLRQPVPFPDNSVIAVFHEHLLEHLPISAAGPFLRECHRLVRPGGILRVGVPDFGRYARDYSGSRSLIGSVRPARPTALLAISELAYCYDHVSVWDDETLLGFVEEAGFEDAHVRAFGESAMRPAPDGPWRAPETLYVEAVKT